jgi:3-deoxy-D-manno-octulosonic-acid transferase
LGEYEQAHPLIVKIKAESPDSIVFLSFFSISGFENLPANSPADFVFYLPFDIKKRIRRMINHLKPDVLFLVKSEIWPNLIQEVKQSEKPIFLISAKFSAKSPMFHIPLLKNSLNSLTAIFTQDDETTEITRKRLNTEIITTGNTRIERVLDLKESFPDNQLLIDFCQRGKLIVLGSIYPADMKIIQPWLNSSESSGYHILVAPHEIDPTNIQRIQDMIQGPVSLLSDSSKSDSRILILDSIGQLSRVYRYASVAYIGGGFEKGIHNILEPSVHGIPVCFGPNYEAFYEANTFINNETGFCVKSPEDFLEFMQNCRDNGFLEEIKSIQEKWFEKNASSTTTIMDYLRTQKLLPAND